MSFWGDREMGFGFSLMVFWLRCRLMIQRGLVRGRDILLGGDAEGSMV